MADIETPVRDSVSRAHTAGDIEGSAAKATLVATAVEKREGLGLGQEPHVQSADPLGAVELVR